MAVMTFAEAEARFAFHPARSVPVREVVVPAVVAVAAPKRTGFIGRARAAVQRVAVAAVPEWQKFYDFYTQPERWALPRAANVLPAF